MITGSPLLSAIPGLRHAFFDRDGGVSGGVYASLNGGIGSNDDPAYVTENRRRMAEQMAVRVSPSALPRPIAGRSCWSIRLRG
jgi:copper oxidase (laccase) domain-containing protein